MGTFNKEVKYRCSDDCLQSGCPSHTAKMMYQSTADILSFETSTGYEIYFERGALDAFFDMFSEIACSRVELWGQILRSYNKAKDSNYPKPTTPQPDLLERMAENLKLMTMTHGERRLVDCLAIKEANKILAEYEEMRRKR